MANVLCYWKWIAGVAAGLVSILTAYSMLQAWKPVFANDLADLEARFIRKQALIQAEDNLRYWSQEVRTYQIHPPIKTGDERTDSVNREIWLEDLNSARSHKKYFRQKLNDLRDK